MKVSKNMTAARNGDIDERLARPPVRPEYVETPATKAIVDAATIAMNAGGVVSVKGPSGIGKTGAILAVQEKYSGVVRLRASFDWDRAAAMFDLGSVLDGPTRGVAAERFEAIARKLRGPARRLVVVDDADQIRPSAAAALLDLIEQAKIGVLLLSIEGRGVDSESRLATRITGHLSLVKQLRLNAACGSAWISQAALRAIVKMAEPADYSDDAIEELTKLARGSGYLFAATRVARHAAALVKPGKVSRTAVRDANAIRMGW